MSARFFFFWCERCPTRITVETEVTTTYPEPEYNGAFDGVASYQARDPGPHDDGVETADLCPACGGELVDVDELLMRKIVPYHDQEQTSDVHAAWRRAVADKSSDT